MQFKFYKSQAGNVATADESTDKKGNVTRNEYDKNMNVKKVKRPVGEEKYEYLGDMEINPNGFEKNYVYDELNRQTKVTDASGAVV